MELLEHHVPVQTRPLHQTSLFFFGQVTGSGADMGFCCRALYSSGESHAEMRNDDVPWQATMRMIFPVAVQ